MCPLLAYLFLLLSVLCQSTMDFRAAFAFALLLACSHGQNDTENEILEIALTTTTLAPTPPSTSTTQTLLRPGQLLVQRIQNITAAAASATKPIRDILPKCACSALTCDCCINFGFQPNNPHSACASLQANLNDLKVILDLSIDGNILQSHTLAPSNFPICASYPPISLCFTANNILIGNGSIKVCSTLELRILQASLYNGQLPCFGFANGQISWTDHPE